MTFTHIYSSHLQRAVKTAVLIRGAQLGHTRRLGSDSKVPDVVQLPILMERDFGSLEGKKWYEKPLKPEIGDKETSLQDKANAAPFIDVESAGSMAKRTDKFLDEYLLPLLNDDTGTIDHVAPIVAVVSHGVILSVLWKRLLLRLSSKSVTVSAGISANPRISLQNLGAWSNTGYLELNVKRAKLQARTAVNGPAVCADLEKSITGKNFPPIKAEVDYPNLARIAPADIDVGGQEHDTAGAQPASPAPQSKPTKLAYGWTAVIRTVNGKEHLKGLKRTRGGVGSAQHDASQKSIDVFFKRQKVG